jgi:hypothetical protein
MRRMIVFLGVILGSVCLALAGDKEGPVSAKQAGEILKTQCYRCHGEKGAEEGGASGARRVGWVFSRERPGAWSARRQALAALCSRGHPPLQER